MNSPSLRVGELCASFTALRFVKWCLGAFASAIGALSCAPPCQPVSESEAREAALRCDTIELGHDIAFRDLSPFAAASGRDVDWIVRGTPLFSLNGVENWKGSIFLEDNRGFSAVNLATLQDALVIFDETPSSLLAEIMDGAEISGPGTSLLGGVTLLAEQQPRPIVDLTLYGTGLLGLPVTMIGVDVNVTIIDAPEWSDLQWVDGFGVPISVTLFLADNASDSAAREWFARLWAKGFRGSFELCARDRASGTTCTNLRDSAS